MTNLRRKMLNLNAKSPKSISIRVALMTNFLLNILILNTISAQYYELQLLVRSSVYPFKQQTAYDKVSLSFGRTSAGIVWCS